MSTDKHDLMISKYFAMNDRQRRIVLWSATLFYSFDQLKEVVVL